MALLWGFVVTPPLGTTHHNMTKAQLQQKVDALQEQVQLLEAKANPFILIYTGFKMIFDYLVEEVPALCVDLYKLGKGTRKLLNF